MITKQELKSELILLLEEKINDINYILDEETSPFLESMNNPDDEDYEYSNSEFNNLTNNANNLKDLIDKLINNLLFVLLTKNNLFLKIKLFIFVEIFIINNNIKKKLWQHIK